LVNAGESASDPIHDVIESLLGAEPYDMGKKPREGQGSFDGRSSAKAPGTMTYAYNEREKLRGKTDILSSPQKPMLEKGYRDACVTCYGRGSISNYSKVWHPQLGLITDSHNSIMLRLNDEEDLAAFRKDLIEQPSKIQAPIGPGGNLALVRKQIALSASLPPDKCDYELIDGILALGMPAFVLPHTSHNPIEVPYPEALSFFCDMLKASGLAQVATKPHLVDDHWCATYEDHLWQRLVNLPRQYRFAVLEVAHKLEDFYSKITLFTRRFSDSADSELRALMADLYTHTLRGVYW
jgi:hypothetical protein